MMRLRSVYFCRGDMLKQHNWLSEGSKLRKRCPQNNGNVNTNYTRYPIFFTFHHRSFERRTGLQFDICRKNWPQVFFKTRNCWVCFLGDVFCICWMSWELFLTSFTQSDIILWVDFIFFWWIWKCTNRCDHNFMIWLKT